MLTLTKVIQTFPSVRIPSHSGGLSVEVSLIAQMGHGSGNHLFASVSARQKAHEDFVDELDEPSAKLGGTDFTKGDPTSLYSFAVGPKGHPFHRHAGHRVFTAVSGSGGAQLRFSSASDAQIEQDPQNFIKALRYINIPPDCIFTVRFGGETWHQFAPIVANSPHPVFFALSCHTNELGGALPDALREKVLANQADIPSLTEVLPQSVVDLLRTSLDPAQVHTTDLALEAPPGSLQRVMCTSARGRVGVLRGAWATWRGSTGFLSDNGIGRKVLELDAAPAGSLLLEQLVKDGFHHEDTFCLRLEGANFKAAGASVLLGALLEGFLQNPPTGVSRMMAFRNALVRPLGLRTSPLGCPVSSLLSPHKEKLFANRYPVHDQAADSDNTRSQVILGADDKHLIFRSCVGVEIVSDSLVEFTLGTRVRCKNPFGRIYMALINHVHRSYVTPAMLRLAVEHAILQPGFQGQSGAGLQQAWA
ncbi:DUF2867 domain-containing protein [Paraherbaspirillum soli]|uniref:DUF2867 domain-containing protein n=1 Tax=Paraherbaspirillum soli TaxID=631222 RepID=A0ABW0M7B3_9BURK